MVAIPHTDILQQIDLARLRLAPDDAARAALGQVLTPTPLARLMAGLLHSPYSAVSLLDPGAGIGILSAAAVAALCARAEPPKAISITACEIDARLLPQLHTTLALCLDHCASSGVAFTSTVIAGDFLAFAATQLEPMFAQATPAYNIAILNPPYRKIQTASPERRLLSQFGVEVSNLYAGFVAMALKLLAPGGELVAITPRSFCNGPYFRPFRKLLLERAALRSFYVFDTRQEAFRDDSVLQETIITAAVVGEPQPPTVTVVTALIALGRAVAPDADQNIIDVALSREVFGMSDLADPTQMQRRIQEALDILKLLGLPRAQQNERSALTLLALLNLAPSAPWPQAEAPLCGITPMMKFFEVHYGRTYAPNTRETVRRQTVHQFLEAGFIVANPDEPSRPVNSPKAVYQIEPGLLAVLQTYGLPEWGSALQTYLSTVQTLSARYARERAEMTRCEELGRFG